MHFEHPAVLEVAVTAKRDEKNLVKPKAWVVLKEGIAESPELVKEIQQWVMDRTAKYKYPRWVVFVKELPKSATGKIQRFQLRDSFPMEP